MPAESGKPLAEPACTVMHSSVVLLSNPEFRYQKELRRSSTIFLIDEASVTAIRPWETQTKPVLFDSFRFCWRPLGCVR